MSEATQRTLDALQDEWTRPYRDVLKGLAVTPCREWCEDKSDRCNEPAEFVLWGKLFEPSALGPRCYDHAATHAGHQALGDPSWAIIDLRPALRLLISDASRDKDADHA